MSLKGRLQRLENVEQERATLARAARIAEKHGRDVDELLRQAREIGLRVERWGMDEEIRRQAERLGISEDTLRARYQAVRAEMEEE
jgi:hypothetical protein